MDLHGASGQRESEEGLEKQESTQADTMDKLRGGEPPAMDRTLAASSLRLPGAQAPLPALHARDGRAHLRDRPRTGHRRRRSALRQQRARTHFGDCVLRRMDAAHVWRADDSRRRDRAVIARQHRPAGRRHPRAARPCVDSRLDRHPDALRAAARLHPDAPREGSQQLGALR